MAANRKKLGEILVTAGVLDPTHLSAALAEQRKWGGRLGRTLVELGFVDETTMCAALSRQLGLPALDLSTAKLPDGITQALPVDLCERFGVMPVAVDAERRVLKVATSDPTNFEALRDIGFRVGKRVEAVVATASDVDKAIRRYYYGEATEPMPAATPQDLGVPEQSYAVEQLQSAAAWEKGEPSNATSGLVESVARLEQMFASEVHALKTLVQLLVEKGLLSREEYLARVKKPEPPRT